MAVTPPLVLPVKCPVCPDTLQVTVSWTAQGQSQLVGSVNTDDLASHIRNRHLKYP